VVEREYTDVKTGKFKKGNPGRKPGIPALQKAMIKLIEDDPREWAKQFGKMLKAGDAAAWGLLLKRAWAELPKPVEIGGLEDSAPIQFGWKQPKKKATRKKVEKK
jgi:hypothetical protein